MEALLDRGLGLRRGYRGWAEAASGAGAVLVCKHAKWSGQEFAADLQARERA